MSYQLAFWQTKKRLDPARTYQTLVGPKGSVRGLTGVRSAEIEADLLRAFPGAETQTVLADGHRQTILELADDVSIDISWLGQAVVCTCYGDAVDAMNTIIGVMAAKGFPLFDPQTGERFGSAS